MQTAVSAQPVLLRRPRPPTNAVFVDRTGGRTGQGGPAESQTDDNLVLYRRTCRSSEVSEDDDRMPHYNSLQELSKGDPSEKLTSLVRPRKSRGPDPLPGRTCRQTGHILYTLVDEEDLKKYYQLPQFTLQDFIVEFSAEENVPVDDVEKSLYSPFTYSRLQKMLQERCRPRNTGLSTQQLQLPEDLPQVQRRVPHRQLLVEMTAIIKEQLSKTTGLKVKSSFQRTGPSCGLQCDEVFFYHDSQVGDSQNLSHMMKTELPGSDSIVRSAPSGHVTGSHRSGSPFVPVDPDVISPSEMGVLDALLNGGRALSLKAQFLSVLPDVQLLIDTVEYLNLSFNNFPCMPVEIFEMSRLSVLLLRNNPLKEIAPDIEHLQQLHTVVLSFCQLTALPQELFHLVRVQHLDVSYNLLTCIPSDIQNMTSLEELKVEGNQLTAMPAGLLRLRNLHRLRVTNNFMHPLFWKDALASHSRPQKLVDLSSVATRQLLDSRQDVKITSNISDVVSSREERCDACGGRRYGNAVTTIRPISKVFGVKHLPVLFHCCSPACRTNFMTSSNALQQYIHD